MPSCRMQLEILGLRPGNPPQAVMQVALASIEDDFHVDDHQIDVVAGTARISVRFTVPDASREAERVDAATATRAAREAVDQVAVVGRAWLLRREGGRWLPMALD